MNGIRGADRICRERAERVALPGTWIALLSAGAGFEARERIGSSWTNLTTMDGKTIATSAEDLWDGQLYNGINRDEFGMFRHPSYVWTGTNWNGSSSGATCRHWTFPALGGWYGGRGISGRTDSTWIAIHNDWHPCGRRFRIYCIEQ